MLGDLRHLVMVQHGRTQGLMLVARVDVIWVWPAGGCTCVHRSMGLLKNLEWSWQAGTECRQRWSYTKALLQDVEVHSREIWGGGGIQGPQR